jgi:hypothetical protein
MKLKHLGETGGQTNFRGDVMIRSTVRFSSVFLVFIAAALCNTAHALPVLQLGPTSAAGWSYDAGSETWVFTGGSNATANLSAFANATKADGGKGAFAWDAAGAASRWAYLVVAAVPDLGGGSGDNFDISVNGASFLTSGYGNPPVEDPNSLSPHGIYDTYFEIYKFQFDGPLQAIFNTSPNDASDPSGMGYSEAFQIQINSLKSGVTGLHFDLFTVIGDGVYQTPGPENKDLVAGFAPYSHDAQWNPGEPDVPPDQPPPRVPVPSTLLLLGLGLTALGRRQVRRS